jgi:alkylhydroperoxidase family enzyme
MKTEMAEQSDTPRLAPLPSSEWPPEMEAARQAMRANAPRPSSPPPAGRPQASNAMGTFANHPALAHAYFTFNGHILYTSSIEARHREMVILRVAALRRSEYEWAQHVHLGRQAGLDDSEIERVIEGPGAADWSPFESALLAAADQLIADARIDDDTWSALAQVYDERQLMDLVFTVGAYETLAMAFCSFGVQMDADLEHTTPRLSRSD